MVKLSKITQYLLVFPFVLFLIVSGATGQQTVVEGECPVDIPTIPGVMQDIDKWKPQPTLYADSDEIAPGGNVNLWVDGGCQQSFTWSVIGTGYTLSPTPPWNDHRRMTLTCASGT